MEERTRRAILDRLSTPSPITPAGPPISELRHIQRQTYSRFTLQLLRDLVENRINSVTQRMNWFETQAMRQAAVHCTQAYQQALDGAWEAAEQLLLDGLQELAPRSYWTMELSQKMEECRRGVSELLLAEVADRESLTEPLLLLLQSVGCHAGKT